MGNCCNKLSSLFGKRENKEENGPLLVDDPLLTSDDSIIQNHAYSPILEICHDQETNPGISFRFGSPIILESSDGAESTKSLAKHEIAVAHVNDEDHHPKPNKKEESEEEGYSSSFEAVSGTSKDPHVGKDSNVLGTPIQLQQQQKKYEAEVQAELEFIQADEECKSKAGES